MDKDPASTQPSLPAKVRFCLANGQITEATVLVCGVLGGKPFEEYEPDDLEILFLFFSEALPRLLNHHITWLISNPQLFPLILDIAECARSAGIDSAQCARIILRLHCIQAFYYANQSNWEQAMNELRHAIGEGTPISMMENGVLSAKAPGAWESFLTYLHTLALADSVEPKTRENILLLYEQIKDILSCMTREETRSGVVRVILVDYTHKRAVIRLLMVRIAETDEKKPKITYLPAADEKLDEKPLSAQRIALDVAHEYLQKHDYPDGLSGKEIFWQLLTDQNMPPQDTRSYEGDSLSVALCTAVVSEYLNQPVPSDVAMTGAFHVDALHEGRIGPVNFIQIKVQDAVKAGIRELFLPDENRSQLDVITPKTAEEHRCSLRFVHKIDEIFSELFVKEVPPGVGRFLMDMAETLWCFLPGVAQAKKSSQEVNPFYRIHIGLSIFLITALFILDWFMWFKEVTLGSLLRISLGLLIIIGSILISYALPLQFIRRKKTGSWYAGIFITLSAVWLCIMLAWPDIKENNLGSNWPPILSFSKDYFIFWLFIWVYATNVFNVIVAYEALLSRRQFRTLQDCLRWDSWYEGNMPITCFPFPWAWGALVASVIALFLIVLEIQFYQTLIGIDPFAVRITTIGISRDLLFIVAAAEVLLFYKNAVAKIKRELFQ